MLLWLAFWPQLPWPAVRRLNATLTGYEESPSVSTVANGDFSAIIENNGAADHFHYTLTYSGLQGTVSQTHIHIAQAERERQHRYLAMPDGHE